MSFASSNRTAMRYVAEATYGTTPATPTLKPIRYTGESVNYALSNIVSNEIREDRMTADLIQVSSDAAGDLNFEFSAVAFDDFLQAAMCSAWATNTLKNGTTTSVNQFTIQKHLQDAETPTFINFTGMRVGRMALNFQVGQILTGTFGLMGLAAATSESQIAGAIVQDTATAGFDKTPMNAVSNVVDIEIDDVASTSCFNTLTLDMTNNLRAQDCIGSLAHSGIALGKVDLTGNISMFFKNKTMLDKYINATSFKLEFTAEDAAGNSYKFTLPVVKFETGSVVSSSTDSDIVFDATWRATYDSTSGTMLQIDRTLV